MSAVKTLNDYPSHIGIPVSDIVKTEAFYTKLGFEIVDRYPLDRTDGKDAVLFAALGEVLLEFYEVPSKEVMKKAGAINHVAIKVANLEPVMANLDTQNVTITEGPNHLPFGERGMSYIMIEGPDRERVEFNAFH